MPVSRPGPPETLGQAYPLALGRQDGDSFGRGTVTAGHLAPTLGEPDPSQSRGDAWIRVMGGRLQSVRNDHWLSREKYVLLTHISKHSSGDPLVIAL